MVTTATWDYSIHDVSGLSHDGAWKKLRDLPLPPISDQLATYFQQRAAQSAHFEDVETLIANNHNDDSSDDGHEPPSRAKTGNAVSLPKPPLRCASDFGQRKRYTPQPRSHLDLDLDLASESARLATLTNSYLQATVITKVTPPSPPVISSKSAATTISHDNQVSFYTPHLFFGIEQQTQARVCP